MYTHTHIHVLICTYTNVCFIKGVSVVLTPSDLSFSQYRCLLGRASLVEWKRHWTCNLIAQVGSLKTTWELEQEFVLLNDWPVQQSSSRADSWVRLSELKSFLCCSSNMLPRVRCFTPEPCFSQLCIREISAALLGLGSSWNYSQESKNRVLALLLLLAFLSHWMPNDALWRKPFSLPAGLFCLRKTGAI